MWQWFLTMMLMDQRRSAVGLPLNPSLIMSFLKALTAVALVIVDSHVWAGLCMCTANHSLTVKDTEHAMIKTSCLVARSRPSFAFWQHVSWQRILDTTFLKQLLTLQFMPNKFHKQVSMPIPDLCVPHRPLKLTYASGPIAMISKGGHCSPSALGNSSVKNL